MSDDDMRSLSMWTRNTMENDGGALVLVGPRQSGKTTIAVVLELAITACTGTRLDMHDDYKRKYAPRDGIVCSYTPLEASRRSRVTNVTVAFQGKGATKDLKDLKDAVKEMVEREWKSMQA